MDSFSRSLHVLNPPSRGVNVRALSRGSLALKSSVIGPVRYVLSVPKSIQATKQSIGIAMHESTTSFLIAFSPELLNLPWFH